MLVFANLKFHVEEIIKNKANQHSYPAQTKTKKQKKSRRTEAQHTRQIFQQTKGVNGGPAFQIMACLWAGAFSYEVFGCGSFL